MWCVIFEKRSFVDIFIFRMVICVLLFSIKILLLEAEMNDRNRK